MKTNYTPLFLLLMAFFLQPVAQAQDQPARLDTLSLKDLLNVKITTASRTSQSASLASATITVVTREQIRARNYQSLLDLMFDLPDIKVDDKMYSGMRNSFTVRGTQGSEKFLVMLDGVNIGTPSGEAMPIMENYPVHFAEQVEILYGPASALYGADAVSGIINIITKKKFYQKISSEVSLTKGSYGYTNAQFYMATKLGDQTQLFISGQFAHDKNPDYSRIYRSDSLASIADYASGTMHTIYGDFTPSTPVKNAFESPMQAYNIYAALRSENFTFSLFRNYTRTPTSLGANYRNTIFNKDVYMGQAVSVATALYKKSFEKITSSTSLSVSTYVMDPESNYRNLYTGMEPGYKYSSTSMMRGEQQLDYSPNNHLKLTAGSTYEYYNAIPQSTDLANKVNRHGEIEGTSLGTQAYYNPSGLPASFYHIQYHNLGLYIQGQYARNKNISLTVGARYDRNARFGPSFNPRVGIVFALGDRSTLKMLYGRAFRAPTPSESYAQYGSFITADSGRTYYSNFLHLPNTGLKPVRAHNAEINFQQQFTDNFVVTVNGYYTLLSGLYAFADDNQSTKIYNNLYRGIPVDYIEVFINNDRQKNFGGSIQLKWKKNFRSFSANSQIAVSYVNGLKEEGLRERDETSKDMQLDFIAPLMVHISTDLKSGKFSFSPRLLIMGRQHIAGIADTTADIIQRQTIAGYALLNASLRYQYNSKITFYTSVTNALNQKYRAVGFNMDLEQENTELFHGLPQDPLRITTGINLNF